jgi:chromosome segregation ATPase
VRLKGIWDKAAIIKNKIERSDTAMKKKFAIISFLFLVCFISSVQTPAQETAKIRDGQSTEQVLREILAELKQLRFVVAKTNASQLRFQITFDQYKAQQARVDSMTREMESLKNQLTASVQFRSNNEEMIKTVEERLQQTADPRQRQALERQVQQIKRNLETQDQREKRMKERQTNLEMQVPAEQVKLDQINFEMERIKQDLNSLLNQ